LELAELLDELAAAGLERAEVARAVGTSQRTVARWQAGAVTPRTDLLDRLLELAAVVEHLRDAVGEPGVRLWLRAPNRALGHDKPLERIAAGGYREVLAAAPPAVAAPRR
jgi:transcriptional regulator with XRE-family HTH domain